MNTRSKIISACDDQIDEKINLKYSDKTNLETLTFLINGTFKGTLRFMAESAVLNIVAEGDVVDYVPILLDMVKTLSFELRDSAPMTHHDFNYDTLKELAIDGITPVMISRIRQYIDKNYSDVVA